MHPWIRSIAILTAALCGGAAVAQQLPYPILFVTQFPISGDFTAIGSVFGNHRGNVDLVGRGGDLYIRYPDGSLRNLTQEAGYGNAGQQGATSIGVRPTNDSWQCAIESLTSRVMAIIIRAVPIWPIFVPFGKLGAIRYSVP